MLSTSSQTVSTKAPTQTNSDVFGTLVYFLHKVPVLLKLFFGWIAMSSSEKTVFSLQILQSFSWDKHHLCTSIVNAFSYWEKVQDTEGAPGFNENPLKSELNQEITADLKNIIKAMEVLVQQMMAKRKVNASFLKIIELKSDPKAELVKCTPDGSGEFFK